MLGEGRRAAAEAGIANINWVQARAEDLPDAAPGPYRLVTFGQSFHWTDELAVAEIIYDMLEPGGALAMIVHTVEGRDRPEPPLGHPPIPHEELDRLVVQYLGPERRMGQGFAPVRDHKFADILIQSRFGVPREVFAPGIPDLLRDTDSVISGYLSMSSSAPHLFGDRLDDFVADAEANSGGGIRRRVVLGLARRHGDHHRREAMIGAVLWSALATVTLLVGMWLAYRNLVSDRWTALIMALGAGAIISAAAYQLVLGAVIEDSGKFAVVGLGIAVGALTFYLADRWVDRRGGEDRLDFDGAQSEGSATAILLGSLLDGVPESLSPGPVSRSLAPGVGRVHICRGDQQCSAGPGRHDRHAPRRLGEVAHHEALGCGLLAQHRRSSRRICRCVGYSRSEWGVSRSFAAGALLVMLTDSMVPESFEHGGSMAGLALVVGFGVGHGGRAGAGRAVHDCACLTKSTADGLTYADIGI